MSKRKSAFLGLMGQPNVGKSSFLNLCLQEELSIVSSRPQTTRQHFRGIWTQNKSQVIFLDAPGYVSSSSPMLDYISSEFDYVLRESDRLLLLIAADQKKNSAFDEMVGRIEVSKKPWDIVLTKKDLEVSESTASFLSYWKNFGKEVFSVDNINGTPADVEPFLLSVADKFPAETDYLYDPEQISPMNLRDLVGEWIRESCFKNLDKEIPYGMAVKMQSFKETSKLTSIHASLIVDKENHKGIVIGQGGKQLGKIGQEARVKIEEFLGQKVFLKLHVAVRKNWQKKNIFMKEYGYGKTK